MTNLISDSGTPRILGMGDISMTRLDALIGHGVLFQKLWIADHSPWRWGSGACVFGQGGGWL